jgi:hypothetical protein
MRGGSGTWTNVALSDVDEDPFVDKQLSGTVCAGLHHDAPASEVERPGGLVGIFAVRKSGET